MHLDASLVFVCYMGEHYNTDNGHDFEFGQNTRAHGDHCQDYDRSLILNLY